METDTYTQEFSELEENRQVYSRVVRDNGDIVITSDLFEAYNLDPSEPGFFTVESPTRCYHFMTSLPDESGTVVQVGQYCAFSFAQQVMLFAQMLVVTLAAVGTTYFAGSIMAGRFLAPLEKAVRQTRQFAENCYHELLTPVTVAMSSVSAALKKKDHLAGLRSVDEDLKQVYYSLQTLSRNATLDHTKQLAAAVNLKQTLVQILNNSSTVFRSVIFRLKRSSIMISLSKLTSAAHNVFLRTSSQTL